jgi:hypothetical protein
LSTARSFKGSPGSWTRGYGKNHFLLVAHGLEAEDLEAGRRRPAKLGTREIFGAFPVQVRRKAGVAGFPPINLPALLQFKLQAKADVLSASRCIDSRYQAHLGLLGFDPWRGRGPGRFGNLRRRRQHGANHKAADEYFGAGLGLKTERFFGHI